MVSYLGFMREFFKHFKIGFQKFSHLLADLVNIILLAIVYYVGVGLTSIIAKIFKKSFLDLKDKKVDSYWVDCQSTSKDIDDYYRQF